MTSRQAGKRIGSVASEQKRRSGRRAGVAKRSEPLSPRERGQMIRLVACGTAFVLLVAAKLALPARMERFNAKLAEVLSRNMDVQAVFSAVGRGIAGDGSGAAEEVYQAVFHPEASGGAAVETALAMPDELPAMDMLREYQTALPDTVPKEETTSEAQPAQESPTQTEVSTLAYVLYSDKNLPEDVSLEQVILDFDYCTPVCGTISSPFGYREHPVEGEERFH